MKTRPIISIHGENAWLDNPWGAAVSFTAAVENIDLMVKRLAA